MFYFDNILGFEVLKSDFLPVVNHFFTTRELLLKTKDETKFDESIKNREILKSHFNLKNILTPKQTHSDNIKVADTNIENYEETDALILKDKDLGIFLNFADCTPIILYDTKQKIGAIAHAGWRGTVQKIAPKTVLEMNSNPKDIIALIGPAICFKCFETSEEIAFKLSQTVGNTDNIRRRKGNFYADLKGINKVQLEAIGVEKIDVAPYCTVCNNDKFYSYRKEDKTTDRMSAFLALN